IVGDFNSTSAADGGLTYLRSAGFSDAAQDAAGKINSTYKSHRSFIPSKVTSSYPYDHVVYRAGTNRPISAVASWVVARTRLANGERWEENCLGVSNKTVIAAAGCLGSDHFPVVASLRW